MQLATQDHTVLTGGIMQTAAATAEINGMYWHTILSGIYSDKIEAPIRELSTNARDGHIERGNLDRPFDIHLPTYYDLSFWVRDYGASMDHEFMMARYMTGFGSTKRDSNTQVGMIGVGKFSPYAYVNAYTVTTWLDGVQRTYSCYRAEDGSPHIALMDICDSDEEQGIRVSFACKYNDVSTFRQAAQKALFGFSPYPNIVNETFVRDEPKVLFSGNGWKVYDGVDFPFGTGLYAIQGCVIYPVETKHVGNMNENLRLVVDFPIGELSVTTSREALDYNKTTITNLSARFAEVRQEIADQLSASFSEAPSYWEACSRMAEMVGTGQYYTTQTALLEIARSTGSLAYKGLPLKKSFKVDPVEVQAKVFEPMSHHVGSVSGHLAFSTRTKPYEFTITQMQFTQVIVEIAGLKQGTARARRALSTLDRGKFVIWAKFDSAEHLAAWRKEFGDIPCTDLATVEPMKGEKREANFTVSMRSFRARESCPYMRRFSQAKSYINTDTVVPTEDMLMIFSNGSDYYLKGKGFSEVNVQTALQRVCHLVKEGVIAEGTEVYFLTTAAREKILKAGLKINWLHIEVEKLLKEKFLANTTSVATSSYHEDRNIELAERIVKTGIPPWGALSTFIAAYPAKSLTALSSSAVELLRYWVPSALDATPDSVHKGRVSALQVDFPLIESVDDGSYSKSLPRLTHYLKLEATFQGQTA